MEINEILNYITKFSVNQFYCFYLIYKINEFFHGPN